MSTATTTITQPTTIPSRTAIIPTGSGGGGGGGGRGGGGGGRGGGGGGGGGRGLPAGALPAGRATPLNGKLGGNPPAEFDGNQEKSCAFLLAFTLYRGMNPTVEQLAVPFQ